jgi:hypothetical protein
MDDDYTAMLGLDSDDEGDDDGLEGEDEDDVELGTDDGEEVDLEDGPEPSSGSSLAGNEDEVTDEPVAKPPTPAPLQTINARNESALGGMSWGMARWTHRLRSELQLAHRPHLSQDAVEQRGRACPRVRRQRMARSLRMPGGAERGLGEVRSGLVLMYDLGLVCLRVPATRAAAFGGLAWH